MKKNLTKALLATLIATAPLAANEYSYNANSLFALEGGYASMNETAAGGSGIQPDNFGSYGLKIGAETQDYRIFVTANYLDINNFDYAYTYGVALQYKFNFTQKVNFFLGANGGYADMKLSKGTSVNSGKSISDTYFGGDAGFNFHASELVDLELGGRMFKVNNDLVDNIVTGYASVIIKYQMD